MNRRFEENGRNNNNRFNQITAFLTVIFIVLGALITFFGLST